MSGKYEKRKKRKKSRGLLAVVIIIAVLLLAAVLYFLMPAEEIGNEPIQTVPAVKETATKDIIEKIKIPLKNGLEIVDIGSYTGVYVEDGTDDVISGILMLKVVNNGDTAVEYGKITMNANGNTAEFSVSTLNPGATIVLLEKNRMAFDGSVDYSAAEFTCENISLFKEPLSLRADKLMIQILDGAINVTNISGEDLSGRISIYYKNTAAGVYYGGITYRIILENGLKAGEVRQMTASHFSDTGSEIMFITIAQ